MELFCKKLFLSGLLALTLCILPYFPKAQPGGPAPPFDIDTPIDGGISILVAVGAAYGVKKIRADRKRKSDKLQ